MKIATLTEKERKVRKAIREHRYYLANKESFSIRVKQWARNNPDKVRENSKRSRKRFEGTPKHIFHVLKTNSKKKNRIFPLTQEDFLSWYLRIEKVCTYCGLEERLVPSWCKGFKRLSIDRIKNELPYQNDNMVLACSTCNKVKGESLSFEEMKLVGDLVISKRYL